MIPALPIEPKVSGVGVVLKKDGTVSVKGMQITTETALAVLEVLDALALAEQKFPDARVGDVLACSCIGPECNCKKRNRLIAEFRAQIEADSATRLRDQGIGNA